MEALSGGGLSPLASTFLQSGGEHTHTTEWGEVMARMQAGRLLPEHESGGTRRLAGTQACCTRSKTRGSAPALPQPTARSLLEFAVLVVQVHTYVHIYTYKDLLLYVCAGNYIYI